MLTDNEDKQRRYFDELAHRRPGKPQLESISRRIILDDVFQTLSAQPRHESVLEIGCGDGSSGFTEYFVSQGLQVCFMDISHEAVRRLANRLTAAGYGGFTPLCGTLKEVSHELVGRTFDIIFFGDTLHHLTPGETVVLLGDLSPAMHRMTKVIAFEPNGWYPFWRVMPLMNQEYVWDVERNVVHCTRGGLTALFSAVGMRLESYRFQRIVPLSLIDRSPFWRVVNDVLVRIYPINYLSAYTILVAGLQE